MLHHHLAALGPLLALALLSLGQGSPLPPLSHSLRPRLVHDSPLPCCPQHATCLRFAALGLRLVQASPPSGRGSLSLRHPWDKACPHLSALSLRLTLVLPSPHHLLALALPPLGQDSPLSHPSPAALGPRLTLTLPLSPSLASPSPRCYCLLSLCPCLAAHGLRLALASPSLRPLHPHLALSTLASPSPRCPQAKVCSHLAFISPPSPRCASLGPRLTLTSPLPHLALILPPALWAWSHLAPFLLSIALSMPLA